MPENRRSAINSARRKTQRARDKTRDNAKWADSKKRRKLKRG